MASLVWDRLGNPDNFIEPFAGSCAVMLLRPHPPRIETINDACSYVSNFWRATQQDPEAVVSYADGPVNEVDLHARHRWLVLSEHAKEFRERMRTDPDYFDAKVAGWWCWGLCCWIGSGWCSTPERSLGQLPRMGNDLSFISGPPDATGPAGASPGPADEGGAQEAAGLHNKIPKIGAGSPGSYGKGIHARGPTDGGLPFVTDPSPAEEGGAQETAGLKEQRPQIGGSGKGKEGPYYGQGVHAKGPTGEGLSQQLPCLSNERDQGMGIHARGPTDGGRPQLADAYSLGRGVHAGPAGHDKRPDLNGVYGYAGRGVHEISTGTCEQRRLWLLDWFGRLRDRLRNVRVCCGDWSRVCSSESVTTRLGLTGAFLDPPYGTLAKRSKNLYSTDSLTVAEQVRRWCLERGSDPQVRIALCGYAGEGHEVLEEQGWEVVEWQGSGGYGNRTERGKANAKKERLFFSPHCRRERTLFDDIVEPTEENVT